MILVIDANIIFSTLLSPDGAVSTMFRTLSNNSIFIAPEFLQAEIQ
ncbi:hypothetical protein BH10BAC3_BH10BAC3_12780 [soil metagenome]